MYYFSTISNKHASSDITSVAWLGITVSHHLYTKINGRAILTQLDYFSFSSVSWCFLLALILHDPGCNIIHLLLHIQSATYRTCKQYSYAIGLSFGIQY